MNDDIDLHDALRRGHDLAVLEDGRTVPMRRDPDGDAWLYYDAYTTSAHRGWYYRANGRWCAEHYDVERRERHPRVVATLASAGADDEIVALTGPDAGPLDLQPGDYVLLDDLDGPQHLARVAQAMLTGYPDARHNDETRYALDDTRSATSDWSVHQSKPLAVVIDPRRGGNYGAVWSVPVRSNALRRRRSPDDVLRAAGLDHGVIPRVGGRRVVTRYPAPDDEVGIAFVDTDTGTGPRTVRAAGRDHDGVPCVWLDGDDDDAFRWDGNRYTYCDEGNIVLVEHGEG